MTKRIFNRFDEFEISSVFVESTDEFMAKNAQPVKTKLYFRLILGVLVAINAYLSHWGPWKWPSNYYFLIFTVVFYYVASTAYQKLMMVSGSEGSMIGQYMIKGKNYLFLMKIGKNKEQYTLEITSEEIKEPVKKMFIYYNYFTEQGIFAEDKFQKHLNGFLKNVKII